MTTAPELPLADATAMTRFHRIFREALDGVPSFVAGAPAGDAARAELVGSYYDNVLRLLHAHHEAEDLTIYPMMVERLPEHVEVIERVNAEHETVLGSLGAAEEAVAAWRAAPSTESRDSAAAALAAMGSILLEHLDHEEADVVPLIGRCINVAEWGQMSAVAFQHFTGDKVWLAVGLIQEQLLASENETMEANMPPPVHDFWTNTGRGMFQRYVAELRG
ncbi:hemerythrin domain-containing protein [Nocardioides agariphilus]|uniref:Hemerythrin domain-containing protein n=1 Tax=Nocardioides agariphilus TaxID=433664 RepID=A0A930VLG8_9ACTN|nr:hemerythrin domain-containing protein [Nocardioides agariphilus]MBF4767791.1 hemerythrin domain-containing protein [Nocardioides agariphilus]